MITYRLKKRLIQILIPFILLVIWELAGSIIESFSFKYSSPSLIINGFYNLLTASRLIERYDIYYSFGLTFSETLIGFLIGNIFGSAIGMLLWFSEKVAEITKPYLIVIGAIPIFALAPVMILWFGTGFWAKVMMAAFSTVLVAITQAYEGANNVEHEYLVLFKSFNATRSQILIKLILPSSLIWVLTSYRLNIGFALIGAFIGEWISSEYGIGHLILAASGLYNVSFIFVGLICLIIMALIMNAGLGLVEKYFLSWKQS